MKTLAWIWTRITGTMSIINDPINRPEHYDHSKIQPIDVVEEWELGFNLGNVVKYIGRHQHKDTPLTDLKKAAWYLNREIKRLEITDNSEF